MLRRRRRHARGQHQSEARALTGSAGNFDGAAVMSDDLLHNREPDTRARFAGLLRPPRAIEFLKNLPDLLLVHVNVVISDGHTHTAVAPLPAHGYFRLLRRVL